MNDSGINSLGGPLMSVLDIICLAKLRAHMLPGPNIFCDYWLSISDCSIRECQFGTVKMTYWCSS